jgi:hypothetical protein
MELVGNCNLLLAEGVRCRENEECAVCLMCSKHCLEHFQLLDGLAHGASNSPVKVPHMSRGACVTSNKAA